MSKTPKTPKPFTPAKRGDLVLIPCTESFTLVHGKTTRTTTYALAKVTSVTRDGRIKAAERPSTHEFPWKFGKPDACYVVSALYFDDVDAVLDLCRSNFTSPDEAKAKLNVLRKDDKAARPKIEAA